MSERKERIEALSKEIQEKQAELNELRRTASAEPVEDYVLEGPDGEVRLSELFGDKQDLVVVHNMGSGCPYCTLWADGLNGIAQHLENRTAVAICSSEDPGTQRAFAEGRGWRLPMVSSRGTSFTRDMGYEVEEDGKSMLWPGYSTFAKRPGGEVVRVAHDMFGPGDVYCGLWHMFALLEDGVAGWQPRFDYA